VELVSQIQSLTGKIEEELKTLSTSFTEKNVALAATQRKKVINLASSDFEDFLKPEDVAKIDLLSSESLLTVMVTVPKQLENGFIITILYYANILLLLIIILFIY
jgi:hypothetical protein